EMLAERLSKTIVFCADASDQAFLFEEHIENIDAFIALTSDDEANIMASLLAKRLGRKKAIALIQRIAYLHLVQGGTIDIAISPQQATISALLSYVRKGDIVNVTVLRRGVAEVIESVAHGNTRTSQVIGRELKQLIVLQGVIIGAVSRHGEVLIGDEELMIEENDHVILFLQDKEYIAEVEKLLQPSP